MRRTRRPSDRGDGGRRHVDESAFTLVHPDRDERCAGGAGRQRQRQRGHADQRHHGRDRCRRPDADLYARRAGANGTVVVNTDGTYTYTPNLDFNGTDSFTFTANDGKVGSNIATVGLTVTPVNDAPVAQDGAPAAEDTPISGAWSRPTSTARR